MAYINLKTDVQTVHRTSKLMTIGGAVLILIATNAAIIAANLFLSALPAVPIILLCVYVMNKTMNIIYQGTYSTYKYIKENNKSDSQGNTTRINSVLGIRADTTRYLSDAKLEEEKEKLAVVIIPPSPNYTSPLRRRSSP